MAYKSDVTLLIPENRFPKFYGKGFEYKTPVAVERAPFIHSGRELLVLPSGKKCSQVSYLRWMGTLKDMAAADREHVNEVADLYTNLPFEISCRKCGNNKAEKIKFSFEFTYGGGISVSYPKLGFPFYCNKCDDSWGDRLLTFPVNFDAPFNPFFRRDNRLGAPDRDMLLRDLKRMVYFGFEHGPQEFLDIHKIMNRIREMGGENKSVTIRIDNKQAKRTANILHFLKNMRLQREAPKKDSPQKDLFCMEPPNLTVQDYADTDNVEKYIFMLDISGTKKIA